MAERPPHETERETTPRELPSVPPPSYADSVGTMHLVETMMQIQKSIGELTADVRNMKATLDSHGKKIDRISHIIFAAAAVVTVLVAIVGFIANQTSWDDIRGLLESALKSG